MTDLVGLQKQQFEGFAGQLSRLTESNEQKLDGLRTTVESKLAQIQTDNAGKLEEMRRTVDEKLEGRSSNASANHSRSSTTGSNRSTRDWARCRRWPAASAT